MRIYITLCVQRMINNEEKRVQKMNWYAIYTTPRAKKNNRMIEQIDGCGSFLAPDQ